MFTLQQLFLILIGGGVGAVCRYVATTMIGGRFGTVFPFGTLAVNLLGSFIMGFFMIFVMEHLLMPENIRLLCVVGFLGGFTTFSSFSMETMLLLQGGSIFYACSNMALNVFGGLLAAGLGIFAAKSIS